MPTIIVVLSYHNLNLNFHSNDSCLCVKNVQYKVLFPVCISYSMLYMDDD